MAQMKTIKRILLLCLVVLVVIASVQVKGGYDKYKNALEERTLDEMIAGLQSKDKLFLLKMGSLIFLRSNGFNMKRRKICLNN